MPHQNVGQKKSKRNLVSTFSGKNMKVCYSGPAKNVIKNSTLSGTYLPKRSKLNVIFK